MKRRSQRRRTRPPRRLSRFATPRSRGPLSQGPCPHRERTYLGVETADGAVLAPSSTSASGLPGAEQKHRNTKVSRPDIGEGTHRADAQRGDVLGIRPAAHTSRRATPTTRPASGGFNASNDNHGCGDRSEKTGALAGRASRNPQSDGHRPRVAKMRKQTFNYCVSRDPRGERTRRVDFFRGRARQGLHDIRLAQQRLRRRVVGRRGRQRRGLSRQRSLVPAPAAQRGRATRGDLRRQQRQDRASPAPRAGPPPRCAGPPGAAATGADA